MKIKMKLLSPLTRALVQPEGDVGADVSSTIRVTVDPGETERVPLGFALEIPPGYAGYILPRSGLSKKGIVVWSPPIDPGYRGELHALVYNSSRRSYSICIGDRVAQLVVMPAPAIEFDTVSELSETERGDKGFGSSGLGPR